MRPRDELYEHVEAVIEGLGELKNLIGADRDAYEALRYGGAHGDLEAPPYALRNLLADLEGADGGWLQAEGDAFIEQMGALLEWLTGAPEFCEYCGDPGDADDPLVPQVISPPVDGYRPETMNAHLRCGRKAATEAVR